MGEVDFQVQDVVVQICPENCGFRSKILQGQVDRNHRTELMREIVQDHRFMNEAHFHG